MNRIVIFLIILILSLSNFSSAAEEDIGKSLSFYSVGPFIAILLAIAILPLIIPRWWDKNINKLYISLALGIPVGIYYIYNSPHSVIHTMEEYLSFIILLTSLYIISGGILLMGDIPSTPAVNTLFLAIGSVLASFIGTTGASMLLIRPLIRINSERKYASHTVIFFIFLVSNIGGCLTPLGDPPLYMGYLRGVPFHWTFKLFPDWLFIVSLCLLLYFIIDSYYWKKEPEIAIKMEKLIRRPLMLFGTKNFYILVGIILTVAFVPFFPYREMLMITFAIIAYKITPPAYRRRNDFTYHPIIEVAVLFFGIFLTMIPALDILLVRGSEFGITKPWQFFWLTGSLSSLLDNTPTYLTFLSLAQGLNLNPEIVGIPEKLLKAISLGAVFMGANSYIGNGPNFMVKAIAEERGIKMPSFFGYILYSILILIPLFILHTIIFI